MFVIEGTVDMGYNNSSCYLNKKTCVSRKRNHISQASPITLGLADPPVSIYRTLHRGTDESFFDSQPGEAEDPDLSAGASGRDQTCPTQCVQNADLRSVLSAFHFRGAR